MRFMLDRLRLAPRLATGFALVLVVMSIAAGIGIWRLEHLRAIADELGGASAERALLARELHAIVVLSSLRAESLLVADNAAYAARINADRKLTSARSEAVRKRLEELSDTERGRALYKQIDVAGERFRASRTAMVKRKEAGTAVSDEELQRELRPAADGYAAAVDEFAEYEKQRVAEARQAAIDSATAGRNLLIAGMLVGAALSAWLAWTISRSIVAPLMAASTLAGRVAVGDLTSVPLVVHGRDEVQALSTDLSTMQGQLATLVRNIQQISDSVATASGEIAAGNTDLSQRTEETASSLQQTASSMEQLNGAVRQSADAANQANELAASACSVASRGGEVVSQVVATMSEINTSSKKIADIIGVIDGIAFQTNILALNAAVEAARAGEQGRGFAVVAGEVRSLAQRSAEAAKEIKALIGASVDRVESGSRLVEDAGTTMGDIVASVQRVRDIIGEISVAASEQRTGIGQISSSVNQLDQMTQQNAALVEQSAAAAESLREHATRLASTVQTFRLSAQPALA